MDVLVLEVAVLVLEVVVLVPELVTLVLDVVAVPALDVVSAKVAAMAMAAASLDTVVKTGTKLGMETQYS